MTLTLGEIEIKIPQVILSADLDREGSDFLTDRVKSEVQTRSHVSLTDLPSSFRVSRRTLFCAFGEKQRESILAFHHDLLNRIFRAFFLPANSSATDSRMGTVADKSDRAWCLQAG